MNVQIYEEASQWVVLHRTEALDAESRRRFDAWLRESPHHVRAYLEMSSIWEEVPALEPNSNPAAEELIARARTDSNVQAFGDLRPVALPHAHEVAAKARPRRALWSIAASLLILFWAAAWFYSQRGVYSTEIGEQRVINLSDGSSLELNAQSQVRVHYDDRERSIELLRGQALFRVAKDPSRPFVVESDGTQVRAVGTEFDVYQKLSGTIVTVVEGRVAVLPSAAHAAGTEDVRRRVNHSVLERPDPEPGTTAPRRDRLSNDVAESGTRGSVYVGAGEQLLVSETEPAVARRANVEAATAWRQQRLVFEFTPLKEVAEEFNRYNRRPLVIDDPALQDFHVSGSFSSTDPTLLLRFLRRQPGIAVSETADEIRISRPEWATG